VWWDLAWNGSVTHVVAILEKTSQNAGSASPNVDPTGLPQTAHGACGNSLILWMLVAAPA